jgi:hypothetical protein
MNNLHSAEVLALFNDDFQPHSHIIWHRISGRWINDELDWKWKRSWPTLRYYPRIMNDVLFTVITRCKGTRDGSLELRIRVLLGARCMLVLSRESKDLERYRVPSNIEKIKWHWNLQTDKWNDRTCAGIWLSQCFEERIIISRLLSDEYCALKTIR